MPLTEKDRSYNCTGKLTYVVSWTSKDKASTYTVCLDAAIVRVDAANGVSISTGYGGKHMVQGSTAKTPDEVIVYNRLLAQCTDDIVKELLSQHEANKGNTPYLSAQERKARKATS